MRLLMGLVALPMMAVAGTASAATISITTNGVYPVSSVLEDFNGFSTGAYSGTYNIFGGTALSSSTMSGNFSVAINDVPGSHVLPVDGTPYPYALSGNSMTFSLSQPSTYFGVYWGTVDSYNSISFYSGGSLLETISGSVLNPRNGTTAIYAGFTVTDGTFDKVVLSTTGNSFEIDNVRVAATPLPAALGLFGSAIVGMGLFGAKRRRPA